MTEIALIVFAVLALFHLIYENCILPEIRAISENRLFRLRDDLRNFRYEGEIPDNRIYDVLQQGINNAILTLPHTDLLFLTEVRHAMRSDPKIVPLAKARLEILDEDRNPLTRSIRKKLRREMVFSSLAGMGSWYPYLVPVAVVAVLLDKIKETLRTALALPESVASGRFTQSRTCSA